MVSLGKQEKVNEKYKNIVLFGSTGNGKSTTGNLILNDGNPDGEKHFKESDDMGSCTLDMNYKDNSELKLRVIDLPGTGDTRVTGEVIDNKHKRLTEIVVSFDGNSTNQIDTFLIVVQATPRLSTIKSDLDKFISLFGEVGLKSLIIIIIETNERSKKKNDDDFLNELKKMDEINDILKSGKNLDSFDPADWYLRWDNFEPRENQIEELLARINKVEPYTHEKFQIALKEIEERMNAKLEVAKAEERKKLNELHKEESALKDAEIKKLEEKYILEKKENEIKIREATNNNNMIMEMMRMFRQSIDDNNRQTSEFLKGVTASMNNMNNKYDELQRKTLETASNNIRNPVIKVDEKKVDIKDVKKDAKKNSKVDKNKNKKK